MDPSVGYWPVKGNVQWKSDIGEMRKKFLTQIDKPQTFISRTLNPYVTGTSVIGVKYKDGVMLAADTLASYGSMARFHLPRIHSINKNTLIAASGEMADFAHILDDLQLLSTKDFCINDNHINTAKEIFSYLTRVMYKRRSEFNPLWNQILIAGFDNENNSFLGYVDLYGKAYADSSIATGYGAYIALPLIRKEHSENMSEEEARNLLVKSLQILYYRDARSSDEVQIATITNEGPRISEPFKIETSWSLGAILYD